MNNALHSLIRPHYKTLQGYVSAGMESVKDPEKVFMNANENPFELPGLEGLNRYPEPQPRALLDGYAKLYDVTPDQIVATRGADEAISILIRLFCEPHQDSAIICPPTFAIYNVDVNAMPARVIEVPLIKTNGTYILARDAVIQSAKDKGAKLVFLCSPNNPTGTSFPREDLHEICHALIGHSAVIVDETYIEFAAQPSMTEYLAELPNLIILRTLSKSYALAGMRMGCLIAHDTDFIRLVRGKCMETYPLPVASVRAALKVMEPDMLKLAAENRKKLLSERGRLAEGFKASPLVRHIYPSDANFLLVEMDGAKEFSDYCAKEKIILRDFSDKPMTENCLRISIGLPAENDRLIDLLKSFEAKKAA